MRSDTEKLRYYKYFQGYGYIDSGDIVIYFAICNYLYRVIKKINIKLHRSRTRCFPIPPQALATCSMIYFDHIPLYELLGVYVVTSELGSYNKGPGTRLVCNFKKLFLFFCLCYPVTCIFIIKHDFAVEKREKK